MDNQNNNQYHQNGGPGGYQYIQPANIPGSGLANMALVLGIVSIVTAFMFTLYFPFIFGSIAILMALLSRGMAPKMVSKAKSGVICAVIGIVLNLFIWVYSLALILANPDSLMQAARMYDTVIEQIYGAPSEDILGESVEDAISDALNIFQ